jgi:hypothetical protein
VRSYSIASLVLILLLLTACTGGSGDSAGGDDAAGAASSINDEGSNDRPSGERKTFTAADMCKLLTRPEIEAAVGNQVEEGAPDIGISCDWDSDPDDISVSVHLLAAATPQLCENAFKDDAGMKRESGFGAPAFSSYLPASGGSADVVVCTASGQLQLVVTGGLDDTNTEQKLRTAAAELTAKVLSRM